MTSGLGTKSLQHNCTVGKSYSVNTKIETKGESEIPQNSLSLNELGTSKLGTMVGLTKRELNLTLLASVRYLDTYI